MTAPMLAPFAGYFDPVAARETHRFCTDSFDNEMLRWREAARDISAITFVGPALCRSSKIEQT
jgi:hypothetical protein